MATIQERKLKDGSVCYRVIVRQKGYKAETATFKRKTDAKQWAKQTETAMLEDRHFKTRAARKRTLGDLINRYIKEVMPLKSKVMQKQLVQLMWWKDHAGYLTLADLSPKVIAECRDILLKTPVGKSKPRSPATVNRYLAVLSHALSVAIEEWEYLQDNPVKKVRRYPEGQGRTRFLSQEELTRLLEACTASACDQLLPIVVLAVSTGARKMEILGLRWKDVSFTREAITLLHTKNREIRVVPLKGQALKLLKERSRIRRLDTDLIFPGKIPQAPIVFRKHWVKALAAAQIEGFRFHDLRHTAASNLAMNGASLMEISEILGHKTLQMVKRYSHLTESHTSDIVQKMNEKMLG